ncbi:hypothetical protein [Tessaracoccus defluvii]|uniref:Uncharacterized protein n=1 Tax=Tessaracoccus defluvii TaxID=1285901 RepID=A0A7H0H4K0_9ACTN|nr:hypothetical protein [Tessaracoccus defluvii]QNP55466.1 hypothetical protein H9L22_14880 [Tessaracoccus defluvii]
MTNQQWQQPPQGWQGYPPPPPPRRNNTGWIVLAAFLVVALVGAGAFLLPRLLATPQVISHTPTASPPSPQTTPETSGTPGSPVTDFGLDDAPGRVGDWTAQPLPDGMTGTYYTAETILDANGLEALIVVDGSGMSFAMTTSDMLDPVVSSGGRVACGTSDFMQDMVAIADAIAALHP